LYKLTLGNSEHKSPVIYAHAKPSQEQTPNNTHWCFASSSIIASLTPRRYRPLLRHSAIQAACHGVNAAAPACEGARGGSGEGGVGGVHAGPALG